MKRRKLLVVLGGAAVAWSSGAGAQPSTRPVVGFLVTAPAAGYVGPVAQTLGGLNETGFVEGRNVTIAYRYANNQYDRLPALAADLVRARPAVIFSTGSVSSALAAKAATATIPIVFANGSDPVKFGLVAGIGRPGGNVTGVSFYNNALAPKRLELLRELLPKAAVIALLVNSNNPNAPTDAADLVAAARILGVRVVVVEATREHDLEAAFANMVEQKADAVLVSPDVLFQSRADRLHALAARSMLPAMYTGRTQAASGGLISYGTNVPDMYRQAGVYVGRILRGTKPADLPVLQPTRFELVVNLKTAKALGLTIPESFLLRADQVIE